MANIKTIAAAGLLVGLAMINTMAQGADTPTNSEFMAMLRAEFGEHATQAPRDRWEEELTAEQVGLYARACASWAEDTLDGMVPDHIGLTDTVWDMMSDAEATLVGLCFWHGGPKDEELRSKMRDINYTLVRQIARDMED